MLNLKQYKKYFLTFLIIGFLAYLPILFNGFVWDDITYLIDNPEFHQFSLGTALGPNVFNAGIFYRPISAIYSAGMYALFGEHAFFYHFLQLAIHIANTCLLFIFFCLFFTEGVSLFLGLLFLTHPINVESVAWISASIHPIFLLFGFIALLIATKQYLSRRDLSLICVFLLLSFLAKEVGIVFLFVMIAYRYLYRLGNIKEFIFVGAVVTGIYTVLRVLVGGVTIESLSGFVRIAGLPLGERLLHIPAIVLYYLKTFFYPAHLSIWQQWVITPASLKTFYLPLFISILYFILIFCAGRYFYKRDARQEKSETRHFPQLAFFFVWYALGMGALLQIVPLDMTVADRWFYFPLVGILGTLGVLLQILEPNFRKHRKIYYIVAVLIVTLLSARTFVRSFDWKNNLTLYAHDIGEKGNNYLLLDEYAKELLDAGEIDRAYGYSIRSVSAYPTVSGLTTLGFIYGQKGEMDKAIGILRKAVELTATKSGGDIHEVANAYHDLAAFLVMNSRFSEVRDFLYAQGLKKFPKDQYFYFLLAVSEYNLGNKQKALEAASQAYTFLPNEQNALVYNIIKKNLPLKLGSPQYQVK